MVPELHSTLVHFRTLCVRCFLVFPFVLSRVKLRICVHRSYFESSQKLSGVRQYVLSKSYGPNHVSGSQILRTSQKLNGGVLA